MIMTTHRIKWLYRGLIAVQICFVALDLNAAPNKFTLQDCIDTALKNQPAIRSARENVNAGQGRVTQAASPYLPQVRASTGYSENHSLGGALGGSISKSYTTSVSVNQTLYDFGKTGNALDAARSGTRSSEFDEQRVVQETVLNVKQAYYALLAAKQLVLVAQKTTEQAASHFRQAEAFFQSGTKPRFDVTRAEVEVNSAKLGIITASNNVRLRTIGLYNAMGVDPEKDIEIDDILSSPIAIPPMEQALADSVKNRPEMLKVEMDIQAAQARVKAEESSYFPTLSATGAYNWAHGKSEMNMGILGVLHGDIQDSWNAGVTLSMPLFEGGLTRGRVSEARATLHVLEAQGRSFRQSILIELNQAYADIESATARIAVMELSIKKAQENLELAQGRYEAGVGPYIEVTDAQVASVNAETDHVQALYDYQLAAARLVKAMGRVEQ
jgi:TolC family type I secretion outer membrane protein